MRAVLIIDTSGSMGKLYDVRLSDQTRFDVSAALAVHICRMHLRAGDEVAVFCCNDSVRALLPLQQWHLDLADQLEAALRGVQPIGGSNLKAAVNAATPTLLLRDASDVKGGAEEVAGRSPTAVPAHHSDTGRPGGGDERRVDRSGSDGASRGEGGAAGGGGGGGGGGAVGGGGVLVGGGGGGGRGAAVGGVLGGGGRLFARLFVLSDGMTNLGEFDAELRSAEEGAHAYDRHERHEPIERGVHSSDRFGGYGGYGGYDERRDRTAQAGRHAGRRLYSLFDAVADLASGGGGGGAVAAPVYTTLLCAAATPRSLATLSSIGQVAGCSALAVTLDGPARAHFDRTFEALVSPVARELSFELHASPFSSAERCGERDDGRGLLSSDGEMLRLRTVFPSPPAPERTTGGGGGDGGGGGGDGGGDANSGGIGNMGDGGCGGSLALFRLSVDRHLSTRPADGIGAARGAPHATASKVAAAGGGVLPGAPLRTSIAMRVELASGERIERHYSIELPLLLPPPSAPGAASASAAAAAAAEPPTDVFQTEGARKAVALWYYTETVRVPDAHSDPGPDPDPDLLTPTRSPSLYPTLALAFTCCTPPHRPSNCCASNTSAVGCSARSAPSRRTSRQRRARAATSTQCSPRWLAGQRSRLAHGMLWLSSLTT